MSSITPRTRRSSFSVHSHIFLQPPTASASVSLMDIADSVVCTITAPSHFHKSGISGSTGSLHSLLKINSPLGQYFIVVLH